MKISALPPATILLLAGALIPHAARAAGGCPTSPAKFVEQPQFTLPETVKNTAKTVAFQVDIGSDGRVRGLQLVQSSGDGAIDLALRQTLQAAAYQPPRTGCVAYSGGLPVAFTLPDPVPPPGSPPTATATPAMTAACTPYVTAFLTPIARDRKRTGTAVVAVELDAAGTQTGAPVLRKSSGSPVLDAEALRIARTGQYNFLRGSPCEPQPFTYSLELTFE